MSDLGARVWRFYVGDRIAFVENAMAYSKGFDQAGFVANRLNFDATVRNLELIGEAATRIPSEIRQAHPEIPWRQFVATRNRLIHGYLGIDNDTLWSIIQRDLPALLPQLRSLHGQPD